MGAEFNTEVITDTELGMSSDQIKASFQRTIEQCEYDYGHSGYTGSFGEKEGVKIHPKTFGNVEDAESFIDKLDTCKWEDADCVGIKGVGWLIAGWCSA